MLQCAHATPLAPPTDGKPAVALRERWRHPRGRGRHEYPPGGAGTMTPERRKRINRLFEAALERDPAERSAFLAEACPDDEELRAAVESLLASREQEGEGGFVGAAAFDVTDREA